MSKHLTLAVHGTYMANTYDFYKPRMSVEYPEVDGQGSITTYLQSLDSCYERYREKYSRSMVTDSQHLVSTDDYDYFILHSPYGKLVQKGFARLVSCLRVELC